MANSCRVFISYSHDSPEHEESVLEFASRLVTEGIDASLDQWVQDPDGGWAFWMERQVTDSDYVIVVCTDVYRQRMEHPDATESGAGAFWEGNIVRNRLYQAKGGARRFIPVFFGAAGSKAIPEALQGPSYYRVDDPSGYIALYRRLTDQPEIEKPALGKLVILPRRDAGKDVGTAKAQPGEATLTAPVEFRKLQALPPDSAAKLQSMEALTRTFIRFDNYLKEPVKVYWLDYEGERVPYATLNPGRSYLQETYVSHPWLITKTGETPVAVFLPESQSGIAAIQ